MQKKISPPPGFSLIKKGHLYLLIKDDYKERILEYSEKELNNLLHLQKESRHYFEGRTRYPTIIFQENRRVVIRRYSHGGLLRFFTRGLFLSGARSFNELILTEEIRSSGIPTVTPVVAVHQVLIPPFYRPYLLTLEFPNSLNLVQYLERVGSHPPHQTILHKRKVIRSAGILLKKFHQAGFYHRDLQLKNLLVSGDEVLIIDFDRSYRKAFLTIKERVKNLFRLNRSADKWKDFGLPISRTDRLRFLHSYSGGDLKFLEEMRRALRYYPWILIFHRLGWRIQKVLKKL